MTVWTSAEEIARAGRCYIHYSCWGLDGGKTRSNVERAWNALLARRTLEHSLQRRKCVSKRRSSTSSQLIPSCLKTQCEVSLVVYGFELTGLTIEQFKSGGGTKLEACAIVGHSPQPKTALHFCLQIGLQKSRTKAVSCTLHSVDMMRF